MEERKRKREEVLAEEVHADLVECFQGVDVAALGDASSTRRMRWPSARSPEGTVGKYYSYLGRERAPEIYQKIVELPARSEILLTGLPGSGKTLVAATISGYLLVRLHRIVYVVGKEYSRAPLRVLREALVLAYVKDHKTVAELLDIQSLAGVVEFCGNMRTRDTLIFVVDEWNTLDPEPSPVVNSKVIEYRDTLVDASYFHVLVKVSSAKSADSLEYLRTDKRLPRIEFSDPFTENELKTWIRGTVFKGLKPDDALMEFYTGYRPRLLKFYAESTGLAQLDLLLHRYIQSVDTFVKNLNEAQLQTAMTLAVGGVISVDDLGLVQRDWSYLIRVSSDAWRVECASSYIAATLSHAILERSQELGRQMDSSEKSMWASAVRQDAAVVTPMNSARIGWNVEALVISVVKATKTLLGKTFSTWKHYYHGGEVDALTVLTLEELYKGVLFVPLRFSETAVDLVVVKLVEHSGGTYHVQVHGAQISVSTYKKKKSKNSGQIWKEKIAPHWLAKFCHFPNCAHEVLYTYVLPQVCHEEVEGVKFSTFGEIDKDLAFVDGLRLPDPHLPNADEPVVLCSGRVHPKVGPAMSCMNVKRTKEAEYFCCDAHKRDVWQEGCYAGSHNIGREVTGEGVQLIKGAHINPTARF